MVIRGKPRGNGKQLAAYLLAQAENDRFEVFDISGTTQPHDLAASILEMSLTAELTKSDKGLYHAQINPAYGEDKQMTREDWLKAASILEDELKLTGQKRVIVLHEKQGRIHAHVVWERYDHAKGKMISDSYSRLAQDRARKTMEKVLMHQKTPDRNKQRPHMKHELSSLWKQCKTGQEFIKAAKEKGYTVSWCRGRRPFMVVDKQGRSFDLVRQLEGVCTKEVREKLQGSRIPTDKKAIKDIRAAQKEKSFTRTQEDMADRIEQHRMKRMAKEEEQQLFKDKREQMKQDAKTMAQEAGDDKLNKAQQKAEDLKRDFTAEQEQKIFREKHAEMKAEGGTMSQDATDKNLNKSQEKAKDIKEDFAKSQEQQPQAESEKDRIRREAKEVILNTMNQWKDQELTL